MRKIDLHTASRGIVEANAMGPSGYGQKLLEKCGWQKGKGLGKKEDGIVAHVRVAKKDDTAALGFKAAEAAKSNDQWFFGDPFAVGRIGGKAAVARAEASDDSSDSGSGAGSGSEGGGGGVGGGGGKRARATEAGVAPESVELNAAAFPGAPEGGDVQALYKKLFKATGGARLGMRARRDQPGKWDRAEAKAAADKAAAKASAEEAAAGAEAAGAEAAGGADDCDAGDGGKRARKEARRAAREERKRLEEKAAKKARKREKREAKGAASE